MIAIIDNYDSFTYNISQYLAQLTDEPITVFRNDAITVADLQSRHPTHIVISPGPGRPRDAGISLEVVRACIGRTPILGICLGMQVIAEALGAKIVSAQSVVHGKIEQMQLDGHGLFRTMGTTEQCMRYHSLVVDPATVPSALEVTARAEDGQIMGLRHTEHLCEGVQFHPESIGTATGMEMLRNFLHYRRHRFPYRTLLSKVQDGHGLSEGEAERFMDEMTDGTLNDAQIAGLLVGINCSGITVDEIVGCATVLRRKCASPFPSPSPGGNERAGTRPRAPGTPSAPLLDTCGTGGDGLGTFNISSMSALVVASCGVRVAKHGNRAVSSRTGSAEFFQQLGIPLRIPAAEAERMLATHNFCFLFAPHYHGALRFAAAARKALGVKTLLNVLGPLANPACPTHQLIGVFDKQLAVPVARAAHRLGIQEVMVVHGEDGQDEISISGPTNIVRMHADGTLQEYTVEPRQYGLPHHPIREVLGGDAVENARIAQEIMNNSDDHTAIRDAVILNAAAALSLATPALTIEQAVTQCRHALQSGAVATNVRTIAATAKAF